MIKNIKKDGIVFSNSEIARIMLYFSEKQIQEIINNKYIRILEPSVGDGSLLIELIKYLPNEINIVIDCLDIHSDFLLNTKNNIVHKKNIQINYINEDYIEFIPFENYDLIISNPPYVKTSTIGAEKSKKLKERFKLSGKTDLYHAFYVKMISELKENGILIIITSNKYLYNKSGKSLREIIVKNLSLDYIIDLGDTKLFDAAILPAILIGKKQEHKNGLLKFFSIYEKYQNVKASSFSSIIDYLKNPEKRLFEYKNKIFECKKGNIVIENNDMSLIEEIDKEFVEKVEKSSSFLLKDIAKIKVGIKTTADKVFLQTKEFREIEEDLVHPIIISKSITKWLLNTEKQKSIIYPYNYNNDKKELINLDEYPKCKSFFENHKQTLTNRTYIMNSSKKWFEIWVPHYPEIWKKEKIVFKDISERGIFAYDKGSIVNGDSFFIILNDNINQEYIYFLLAILNSELMYKYHEIMFPNKLYSNKKRFNSQYLEKYPIASIDNPISKKIISLVKKLISNEIENISSIENQLNNLCEELYLMN